ncbi:SixA phosphatase family protein [Streptomyces sp. NPDC005529]|uniref:SixA phosphatase family protein n=1 Tax=unclassified Streptomyces TaxID=2593676 RepID=UPI0033B7F244
MTSRRMVLVRHAKAEPDATVDHVRPLTGLGGTEATAAGRWLAGSDITIDLALVSTAARTRDTWKLMTRELPDLPKTVYEERLYEASLSATLALVNETPDHVRTLLLVGHNPSIHALADALTGEAVGDARLRMNQAGFPTGAITVLTFEGAWKFLQYGTTALRSYWAPHD